MLRTTLPCILPLLFAVPAVAEDWPCWRGPTRQGISTEQGLPIRWTATENVAWKTAIPGEGWSSPIVFGDRVFVTTATEGGASCRVICLDRTTGKIHWDKEVFQQSPGHKAPRNTYATPTPCTDGKRVYALFGDGSFVALDYEGKVVWTNRQQKFYGEHGLGTSPILYGDLLLTAWDGSSDGPDKTLGWQKPWDQGGLLALDRNSGKVRWRGSRGRSRISHVVPNVFRHGNEVQIISGAGDVVQGFDPEDGRRLWSVRSEGEGVVPSIVIGDGLVFATSGFGDPAIRAIRPGTADDPASAKIVWESKKAVPMIPSFIYGNDLLFTINEGGIAQCFDPRSGEQLWQQRVGGQHSASPICADGKVYFLSDDGESTVVDADRRFRVVARNQIGETCQASYAVSRRQLFIRTDKHLYCVGPVERQDPTPRGR